MQRSDQQKKIRLLIIIDFIGGLIGGTENQLVKLINNLSSSKYDIYLLSFWNTDWIRNNREHLHCHVKIYEVIKLKNPLNFIRVFLIFKYIKGLRPDICMTFFPLSNTLGVLLARLAHVNVILSTRRDYGLWLSSRLGLFLLRLANRFVTRIIANSHNVALLTSREESFDPARIDVIYNGIDGNISQAHPGEEKANTNNTLFKKNDPIIGIIGGLKPMKRHCTFIKSAQNVLQKRADVKFLIVGDGPCRKNLEELADELKVKDCIHFTGSQDDIRPYISLFDIAVNCSSNEGLSNAIMEYMAYGVPCIVSRAGGNEELIEHGVNGYTFELDNDRELADLILDLLEDKAKQAQFIRKSNAIIRERFSLERMIREYDRYFSQLMQDMREVHSPRSTDHSKN